MIKKWIFLLCMLVVASEADFTKGKKIFEERCSSCHKEYISFKKLKENFFERNNELLNLTIPTENMLAWAIMDSSKKIGDPEDPDMRQIEIEEYLKGYLENPDTNNSICDQKALSYYAKKEPMTISDEEAEYLALYFMDYKTERLKTLPKVKKKKLSKKTNEEILLEKAFNNDKLIMVYATSKTCYYCKKMERDVLADAQIQEKLNKNYMFLKIDVDFERLPFNLTKSFKGMTPTFFVVNEEGILLNTYPGAWVKKDFFEIMKENIK